MIISLIAGIAKNNVIGAGNTLVWKLPADMNHFKTTTSGHTVIMGRKTFESIGRPLPNRTNIVITRDTNYAHEGIVVVHSLDEALRFASLELGKNFEENQDEVEVFIIGGGEIYKEAIEKAQKLYITEIDQEFPGDAYFPEINKDFWEEILREPHEKDEQNLYNYTFVEYKKTA